MLHTPLALHMDSRTRTRPHAQPIAVLGLGPSVRRAPTAPNPAPYSPTHPIRGSIPALLDASIALAAYHHSAPHFLFGKPPHSSNPFLPGLKTLYCSPPPVHLPSATGIGVHDYEEMLPNNDMDSKD